MPVHMYLDIHWSIVQLVVEVLRKQHNMLVYTLVRKLLHMCQDMLVVVAVELLVDGLSLVVTQLLA